MRSKYRVLAAMLALRTFTIRDLARFSGVKETTVYTVLRELGSYYTLDDSSETEQRRPGGQTKRYTTSVEQRNLIRQKLSALQSELPNAPLIQEEMDPQEFEREASRPCASGVKAIE